MNCFTDIITCIEIKKNMSIELISRLFIISKYMCVFSQKMLYINKTDI